jgi:hypothetical protein
LEGIGDTPEILPVNFDDSSTQLGARKISSSPGNRYNGVYIDEMIASERIALKFGVGVRKQNNFMVSGLGTSEVMRKGPPPGRPDPRKKKRPIEKNKTAQVRTTPPPLSQKSPNPFAHPEAIRKRMMEAPARSISWNLGGNPLQQSLMSSQAGERPLPPMHLRRNQMGRSMASQARGGRLGQSQMGKPLRHGVLHSSQIQKEPIPEMSQ